MAVRKNRGKWKVDFQYRGRRIRPTSPENTREGALAFAALLQQKLSRNESIDAILKPWSSKKEPEEVSFKDFSDRWFQTYVLPNNKASTHRSKRNALNHHLIPYFSNKKLSEVSVLMIEEFKARKLKDGLSPKTINNLLSVLRKCLTCAEEWEMLAKVPRITWLRVPPSRYKFLSADDSVRLLGAAENIFWYAMMLCALRTGMRIGEICALDWSDINWESRTVTVRRSVVEGVMGSPKNNRTRTIPLTDDLYELFHSKRLATGLLFPGPNGDHLRKSSWPWKALTRACLKAGLPMIGWHALRHTFASELTARSVPMKATQMLLGHSSIQMTERYAHLAPSALQSAVAVLPRSETPTMEIGRNVAYVSPNWEPRV